MITWLILVGWVAECLASPRVLNSFIISSTAPQGVCVCTSCVVMSRNLLSLLLALCAALAAAENSDVVELDADNFHSGIDDKDLILVEFYAPWYVCDRLIIMSLIA